MDHGHAIPPLSRLYTKQTLFLPTPSDMICMPYICDLVGSIWLWLSIRLIRLDAKFVFFLGGTLLGRMEMDHPTENRQPLRLGSGEMHFYILNAFQSLKVDRLGRTTTAFRSLIRSLGIAIGGGEYMYMLMWRHQDARDLAACLCSNRKSRWHNSAVKHVLMPACTDD